MMTKKRLNIKSFRFMHVLLLMAMLASCGSSRKITAKNNSGYVTKSSSYKYEPPAKATNIADYALGFQGTKYKWGGTTKKGMDCSGLVYVAFQKENIQLPRISRNMAKEGIPLPVNQINVGDLLFFKTGKHSGAINHVGLVVKIVPGQVSFIHATTHAGVIVSSLNEPYWNKSFVVARRIF